MQWLIDIRVQRRDSWTRRKVTRVRVLNRDVAVVVVIVCCAVVKLYENDFRRVSVRVDLKHTSRVYTVFNHILSNGRDVRTQRACTRI